MGWRGTLRTLGAIAREAERNAQRRQKEHQRYLVAVEKSKQKEEAAQSVSDYQTHLSNLVSIHKSGTDAIAWDEYANATPPAVPSEGHEREQLAQQRLATYSPSWFTRVLGLTERKLRSLEGAVLTARNEDEEKNKAHLVQYQQDLAEHQKQKQLAQRLLTDDGEAMLQVMKDLDPFREISGLGCNVAFRALGDRRVAAEVEVHGEAVVPKDVLSLLQSGRASVKKMSKVEYYRLYQDYVCSAVLRVARELFAILPIDAAMVTAREELLNTQTGHLEVTPIVSVFIPSDTFGKINLGAIDPSDAMRNFVHEMDFHPTAGFRPVKQIDMARIG